MITLTPRLEEFGVSHSMVYLKKPSQKGLEGQQSPEACIH